MMPRAAPPAPQHQDLACVQRQLQGLFQVAQQADPVRVRTDAGSVVLQKEGVYGPGVVGKLRDLVHEFAGIVLERQGHVQALAPVVLKLPHDLREVLSRGEDPSRR